MYCKPRGRENTVSKDLFTISLLIAGSVFWVGAGSVSLLLRGTRSWIVKALEKGRSLGGGGSIYIYIYIYMGDIQGTSFPHPLLTSSKDSPCLFFTPTVTQGLHPGSRSCGFRVWGFDSHTRARPGLGFGWFRV